MKNAKRKYVRIYRRNWDIDYLKDIIDGDGFTITEQVNYTVDGEKKKSLFGARSIKYGTSYDDEQAFLERHSCECGSFKGKMFVGETCPLCGTVVQAQDTKLKYTGWIPLHNNYIIAPYYFQKLESCLGRGVPAEIAYIKQEVDIDGHVNDLSNSEEFSDNKKHPFVGIGVIEFRKRFNEILDYFKTKRPARKDEIERVRKESSAVFASHIPVYTTALRPESATSDTYYFNPIDRRVNPLFSLSEKLKGAKEIDKVFILSNIQRKVNELWEINFDLSNGKDGFIKGQIIGGGLNHVARNVIIPDPTLRDDQVNLSYHTFWLLFKPRLIKTLMDLYSISLPEAYSKWRKAYKFDMDVYDAMAFMVEHETPMILLNRNPTLNYYSLLRMKVAGVKKDKNDFTLSVPLSILAGLNADFDGDILNILGLVLDEIKYIFRKFDPITRMIMSRDTGLINPYFTLSKNSAIDLNYFCTL